MNKHKHKIILDFDEVLVNSSDAFCKVYNYLYVNEPNFKPASAHMVDTYDFINACPLLKGKKSLVNYIFGTELFFDHLKPFPNVKEILLKHQDDFDYILCSIGTAKNIQLKSKYVEKHFPFIKKRVFLEFDDVKMSKDLVNMDGAILIDDHEGNLKSSNAKLPIAFGNHSWSKDWNGKRLLDWNEVDEFLTMYKQCIYN